MVAERQRTLELNRAVFGVGLNPYPIPPLQADLAFERPRNFRFQAQLSRFTGRELDMGSNADLFWFFLRQDEQPAVYYARHDEFASSPTRDLIPVEPNRLIEAIADGQPSVSSLKLLLS